MLISLLLTIKSFWSNKRKFKFQLFTMRISVYLKEEIHIKVFFIFIFDESSFRLWTIAHFQPRFSSYNFYSYFFFNIYFHVFFLRLEVKKIGQRGGNWENFFFTWAFNIFKSFFTFHLLLEIKRFFFNKMKFIDHEKHAEMSVDVNRK